MDFNTFMPFTPGFIALFLPLLVLAAVWTIVLKGFALWYAARGGQKAWFVALLIVNTLGILELVYLIWFRPPQKQGAESLSLAVK